MTLLYLVKQVEQAVRNHLEQAVGGAGITALQYTALTVLERHPGMTAASLARHSFVRAQTIAQMITVLLERGLIERQPDPASGRQYLISLSAAGQRVLDDLREPVAEIEVRMAAGLEPAQVAAAREALRSFRGSLECPGRS